MTSALALRGRVGEYYMHINSQEIVVIEDIITGLGGFIYVSVVAALPSKPVKDKDYTTPFLLDVGYFNNNYTKLNKLQRALLL